MCLCMLLADTWLLVPRHKLITAGGTKGPGVLQAHCNDQW